MRKTIKCIGFGLLLAFSVFLLMVTTISYMNKGSVLYWYASELERINYIVCAVVMLVFYKFILNNLKHNWSKVVFPIVFSFVALFVIVLENSFWTYISFNSDLQWLYPVNYLSILKSNLEFYFEYGRPDYHYVVAGMLIISYIFVIAKSSIGSWLKNRANKLIDTIVLGDTDEIVEMDLEEIKEFLEK